MKNLILFFSIIATCYLTQPLFAQWSIEHLSSARGGLTATSTENQAYFAGGFSSNSSSVEFFDAVDIYLAATDNWTTYRLSVGRAFLASVAGGGKVFFAGGWDQRSPQTARTFDRVDIYDELTGQWSTARLSEARAFLSAVTVGNKVLFAGGLNHVDFFLQGFGSTNAVDIYDLSTGQWSTATLSQSRGFMAVASNDSLAFFAGGWRLPNMVSNVIDIYNANTDSWSTDTLSIARAQVAGAAVGDKFLFAGGGLAAAHTPTDIVDIYDVKKDEWSTASLSVARGEIVAATMNDKVYFTAGSTIDQFSLANPSSSSNFKEVDIYDDATEQWSTNMLQNGRVNHAATSLHNKLFVAGGNELDLFFSDIEILTLPTVGIEDNMGSRPSVVVYPNPARDKLQISLDGISLRKGKALLHDTMGKFFKSWDLSGFPHEISLSGLPAGIYVLSLSAKGHVWTQKIVKR